MGHQTSREPALWRIESAFQKSRFGFEFVMRMREFESAKTLPKSAKSCHVAIWCFDPRKQTNLGVFAEVQKAPRTGLEPVTCRLTAGRSTIELSGKRKTHRLWPRSI